MREKNHVKPNSVPETLFVGVGGIGSKIITRITKLCKPGEEENIRFVALDTDVNSLDGVHNSDIDIRSIQISSTLTVGTYLERDHDARNNWFPKNSILYKKTVSEGAGQVRAIARLALNATIKTGSIQALYRAIDELFLKDGKSMKQALRVVIVSTSAGGTGSGIAMSVGMLIRQYLEDNYPETAAMIRGLFLLPGVMDPVIHTQTEKESLRRNGYATIKEINAFMMKGSGFFDIEGQLKRYKDIEITMATTEGEEVHLDGLPFDFCFLIDRTDENQGIMMSLGQYINNIALSLYEQNIGPLQQRAFSQEDNIIKELSNRDNLGRNRFGSIGASVLRYPYEEIVNYMAYRKAMDRIGGVENSEKWSRYDNVYRMKKKEFEKSATEDEAPQLGDVYIEEIENGRDRFSKDLKRQYFGDQNQVRNKVERRVMDYVDDLYAYVSQRIEQNGEMETKSNQMVELKQPIEYTESDNKNRAIVYLSAIREYESLVRNTVTRSALNITESIFYNSQPIRPNTEVFELESLLKTRDGGMHPSAVRLILYTLRKELESVLESAEQDKILANEGLKDFSPGALKADRYEVNLTKNVDNSIDDLCAAESMPISKIKEKFGGYKEVHDKLNEYLPQYINKINDLKSSLEKIAIASIALGYINSLLEELERFYNGFEAKVIVLEKMRKDIVESLKFNKGDSVLNVCAQEEIIEELLERAPESDDGMLLPGELNVRLFEAVKRNAEFYRERQIDESIIDRSEDIFDMVLLDYFKEDVRETCKSVIDMNIIDAIAKECEIKSFLQVKESAENPEDIKVISISDGKRRQYIQDKIDTAHRLSAPGLALVKDKEPRIVSAVAYHDSLNDAKGNRIMDYVDSDIHTESVSKYELHFFKALYNVTPDKISRFENPKDCETNVKKGGIYFNAYQNYMKDIGPDSTRDMKTSPHIDKRWDSISALPELSMEQQRDDMMRVHQAFLYALVHEVIKCRKVSRYDENKYIYKFEDKDGELHSFITSNGTECDEFYEIIDALYQDRSKVSDIFSLARKKRSNDIEKNPSFDATVFAKEVEDFRIGCYHDTTTSLFEIPLHYYNSLPSRKRDTHEISLMVDSIIKTLEEELNRYDYSEDVSPHLCMLLEKQYTLLLQNFKEYENIRMNSTLETNEVVGVVHKKVKQIFEKFQPSNYEDRLRALKQQLR